MSSKAKKDNKVRLWNGKRTLQILDPIRFVKAGAMQNQYWEAILHQRVVVNYDSNKEPIVLDRLYVRVSSKILITDGLLNQKPGNPLIVKIDNFVINLETNTGFMHISSTNADTEAEMEMHIYADRPVQIF